MDPLPKRGNRLIRADGGDANVAWRERPSHPSVPSTQPLEVSVRGFLALVFYDFNTDQKRQAAITFLSANFLPVLIPNVLRLGLLRRMRPQTGPTAAQIIATDGVCLIIEAVINALFLVIALFFLPHISRWWALLALLVPALSVGFVLLVRRRFADYRFVRVLDVFAHPKRLGKLTTLLVLVLVLQPLRYYIALHALGIHASVAAAGLAFVLMNVFSVLPFGPNVAVVGSTSVLFGASGLAAAAAAGVVLAATSIIAAAIDSAWTPLVLHRVLHRQKEA